MNKQTPLPLVVTLGDPAGISPEIILKAWHQRKTAGLPDFFVLGDARAFGETGNVRVTEAASDAIKQCRTQLTVLNESWGPAERMVPGEPDPRAARAIIGWIQLAVNMCLEGVSSGLVTGPVHKKTLYDAGLPYPGQTEYVAALCNLRSGDSAQPVMMLSCDGLRVVPVTIHLPLSKVSETLTREMIVTQGKGLHRALVTDFGIAAPRIAVAALNPHGGESGALGREEQDIIQPAVKELAATGRFHGPFPADTLFHAGARAKYDAILCMYHDQALIPLKSLDFYGGVNTTLGLPVVRTSPDHGTAFDIAGKGMARPDSFMAALKQAAHISYQRKAR